MDRRLSHLALLGGFALPLVLTTASIAQVGAPPPPAGYDSGAPQRPTPADQSDRLRQILRLSPDQEGALQAFVAAMSPRPGEAEQMREEARRDAALPTPERVDRMVAHFDEMRAKLLAWAQATKVFYAQLSDNQKRVFDNLPPRRGALGGGAPRTSPTPGSSSAAYPPPPPALRN